jgi:hypothetical protein
MSSKSEPEEILITGHNKLGRQPKALGFLADVLSLRS